LRRSSSLGDGVAAASSTRLCLLDGVAVARRAVASSWRRFSVAATPSIVATGGASARPADDELVVHFVVL